MLHGQCDSFHEHGLLCIGRDQVDDGKLGNVLQADVSIAIEPFHMKIHKPSKAADHIPPFLLGASLVSLPASLTMHYEASPYVLTQLIREARYFMNHLTQVR